MYKWLDLTNPTTQTWLAAVIVILSATAQGTLLLPSFIPASIVADIRSVDAYIVGIYTLITPILFAKSKGPGPLVKT